jgi:hypothetical protein
LCDIRRRESYHGRVPAQACACHGGADYDCYGGTGNGPYYTQPGVTYHVTGSDPYDLDSDGDGLGCE